MIMSLDKAFESALKAVSLIQKEVLRIINSSEFQESSKETRDNTMRTVHLLKEFQFKSSVHEYTEKDKETIIILVMEMMSGILSRSPHQDTSNLQ